MIKIEKKILTPMEFCYGVKNFSTPEEFRVIFASEGKSGKCVICNEDKVVDTVWENPGGTMSIVPTSSDTFFAVQQFYPGFQSDLAMIVEAKLHGNSWVVRKLCDLPYVHRFDIITIGDKRWLMACTLCEIKTSLDDWSSPGKVLLAQIYEDNSLGDFYELIGGLIKNHGYCKQVIDNKEVCIVAAETGVYMINPAEYLEDWTYVKISDKPASEAALIDIDRDGHLELVSIEPFHGNKFIIRHANTSSQYGDIVYEYNRTMAFGHVIWTGDIFGKSAIIGAQRGESQDLFMITYEDGQYHTLVIDENVGPSNIDVIKRGDDIVIASANRENNEAVYYILKQEM